jgi:hypothetical protein
VTLVVLTSLKGSPGVTTLSCLVGASWPAGHRVILVECDPCGSDVAPRFMLSNRSGWSTLMAAARRGANDLDIESHLQPLPGGLEVLVGSPPREPDGEALMARRAVEQQVVRLARSTDVIVDLGRLPATAMGQSAAFWLAHCERSLIVSRYDPSSLLQIKQRAPELRSASSAPLELVLVGGTPSSSSDTSKFTGLPVISQIPDEPEAASVVTTGRGSRRRLERSGLVAGASRLAGILAELPQTRNQPIQLAIPTQIVAPESTHHDVPAPVPEALKAPLPDEGNDADGRVGDSRDPFSGEANGGRSRSVQRVRLPGRRIRANDVLPSGKDR